MALREPGPGSGGARDGGGGAGAEGGRDAEPCLALLPWDRFSAWLHCVCVVGFDLELGQAVEVGEAAVWAPLGVGSAAPFPPLRAAPLRAGLSLRPAGIGESSGGIGSFLRDRRYPAGGVREAGWATWHSEPRGCPGGAQNNRLKYVPCTIK